MRKEIRKIGLRLSALALLGLSLAMPAGTAMASSPGYYDHFYTITATASGNTAIWTPSTGMHFRVMGYFFQITGQSTVSLGGVLHASLYDGASTPMPFAGSFYLPALAVNLFGSETTPAVDLGIGLISAAADNVLYLHLDKTLATGEIRVSVWGVEE